MTDTSPCTVPALLEWRARERPEQCAIEFVGGDSVNFTELHARSRAMAAALQALGVKQGDFVLSWQPNGPTAVLTLLALNCLGAVYVPLNIGYRGGVLEHVVRNSGATLMIAHGELIERLVEIDRGAVQSIVVIGDERAQLDGIRCLDSGALSGNARSLEPTPRPIAPWDTHLVIYTSGTTGPSKGVLSSHLHSLTSAREFRHVAAGDRVYTALPMFHVGGVYGVLWSLIHGIPVIMDASFKTSEFWERMAAHRVTTTGLLGAMTGFLLSQPPSPLDRQHTLQKVIIAPLDANSIAFAERFNVTVFTEYNMTELSVPLFSDANPTQPGLCGKARPGVELRLVDEHDIEVAPGNPGELIIRTDQPWTLSHGYHGMPEATARAWRNGWFHTGDLMRCDPEGNYFFVDRSKDALRRRGENISSFEVESAIRMHPDVHEVAVVAVPAQENEDEVLAIICLSSGASPNPVQLLEFLKPRLPHFMLPRYVRFLDALPKTPTHKIEKHRLRAEGLTADTWDREAAGMRIRRQVLENRS